LTTAWVVPLVVIRLKSTAPGSSDMSPATSWTEMVPHGSTSIRHRLSGSLLNVLNVSVPFVEEQAPVTPGKFVGAA
jgi:hypothetical protein